MFQAGDKVHFCGEEIGFVNGTYVGPFFAGLHHFKDMTGKLCAGEIGSATSGGDGIFAGHHPRGKKRWS